MAARILVIDQTQHIMEWFRTFLEAQGYEVHLMGQASFEMKVIEELGPDLIVLDFIHHEKELSRRTIHQLKSASTTADIPIILCATRQQALAEQQHALLAQGISLVFKPFDIHDFFVVVRQVLQSRQH